MIRTFVAIEVPGMVRERVFAVEQQLQIVQAEVRWVKQENIHLTLKFLGDLEEDRIEELARGIDQAVQGFPPFQMSLACLGTFPASRSPRVIWTGVGEGEDRVVELQNRIERSLAELGFEREDRRYTPHITIGRVKSRRGTEELVAELKGSSFSSEPFRVGGVTIFGSKLTPQGPVYTKLREIKLSG